MNSATNVNQAAADVAAGHILGNETVTGTAGTADKLTFTTATGAAGFNFTTAGAAAGGAGVTGFEQLVLANGTNNITMAQNIVGTATAGSYNVITGGTGYDTITVLGAATVGTSLADVTVSNTVNMTTVTGVEQYNVTATAAANSADAAIANLTFSGAAASGYIAATAIEGTAAATEDATVNITVGNFVGNNISVSTAITDAAGNGTATVNVNGGNQIDTVNFVGAATATTTNFEVINTSATGNVLTLAGGVSQTVNVTGSTAASVNNITLANTNNSDAINLAVTLAGGATSVTADTINVAAANTVANLATVDTISGFQFGVDKLNVTNAGADQDTWSVSLGAGSTAATFVADVNAALNAITGYAAAAGLGDGILVTIASGSALAGTYLISDTTAGAGIDTTAEIVKLTGTTGTFSAAVDLI